MNNDLKWTPISEALPPKGALVLVSGNPNGDAAYGQFYCAVRLQDGWLNDEEALIEEQRGPGSGKRLDGVWVEEMDSRVLLDFTPTHWTLLNPPAP